MCANITCHVITTCNWGYTSFEDVRAKQLPTYIHTDVEQSAPNMASYGMWPRQFCCAMFYQDEKSRNYYLHNVIKGLKAASHVFEAPYLLLWSGWLNWSHTMQFPKRPQKAVCLPYTESAVDNGQAVQTCISGPVHKPVRPSVWTWPGFVQV